MASSPCVLSMDLLRDRGYVVGKTEHWNQYASVRQDLFGIVDIVAFCPRRRLHVYCQTTTRDHLSEHEEKVTGTEPFWWWIQTDGIFLLHGWAKRGDRGRRKLWEVIEIEFFSVLNADGTTFIIRTEHGRANEEELASVVEIPEKFRVMPAIKPKSASDSDGLWSRATFEEVDDG